MTTACAFEIPLEKRHDASPPIQQRLASRCPSPRPTLEDVTKRMDSASSRRELQLSSTQAKASKHNATVDEQGRRTLGNIAKEARQLEQRSTSKQEEAEARR